MIQLTYDVVVDDIEALSALLSEQQIDVKGISTVEDPDAPQTLIFVDDATTNDQKTRIDDEVRIANHKPPATAQPDAGQDAEDVITVEPRKL